ncbi:MAG TPA: glycosyltransferase family 1 protein [Mucilaginibacter sp.]|jgi:glycosyltransferase involved in cell wall biosynthesis|nr:glycosyltransferase family 1 protein [Mucilaginibacter sp.]
MKIGVWVDDPIDKHSGGSFTYINTLISGIDNFEFNSQIEIVFVSLNTLSNFIKPCIYLKPHQRGISLFSKVIRRTLKLTSKRIFGGLINFIDQKEKKIKDASASAYLKEQGVRIIFYPIPSSHVINGIPFIVNNWDLAHFSTYAFPEMTEDNGFHKRNDWYVKIVPDALMVFSETETGKKELSNYLNLNPAKIKVLPMFSSDNLNKMQLSAEGQLTILTTLGLKEQRFFFYPAQFWAHKNHYNLIKAFQKFIQEYPDFKLLLCGSDKGNVAYIKHYSKSLSLEDHVIFSGFIEDEALYTLYKNAKALVMPTFLGPSNIPPIEALNLECPVLCSDLDGHKEMLNKAALYFNPLDDLSILESMKLIMDDRTRSELRQNQKEQSKVTSHTIEKALVKLNTYFVDAVNIRSCWE